MTGEIKRTEDNNPDSRGIAGKNVRNILEIIHAEDYNAFRAVDDAMDQLSVAVTETHKRLVSGGRVFYVGAGTSGRLAAQDAVELEPTYGIGNDMFDFIMAGGNNALIRSVEGAEDDTDSSKEELKKRNLCKLDTVVGISASGRTPFVLGAIEYGRETGALTIGIVNNTGSIICKRSEICILLETGPEVIQGSTRMKAGTSQKIVLNAYSTALAILLGKTYDNIMSHMGVKYNTKLKQRAVNILISEFKIGATEAEALLVKNNYRLDRIINGLRNGEESGK